MKRVLRALPGAICEPNFAYRALREPNDERYRSQYAHGLMKSAAAWDLTTGRGDVIVAVVDSGIDYNHPDLSENMWRNPGETPGNGVDDDGNGVVDDLVGFNAITGRGDPFDDHGHGTHVAGIIGARGDNGIGVAGVAWNVKVLAVKFLSKSGSGSLVNAVRGIEYVTRLRKTGFNIVVMNHSWGSLSESAALKEALIRAGEAGILSVSAAGNSGLNIDARPFYPASFTLRSGLTVGSVTQAGELSSFSNFGERGVHIAAPGSNILSTYPGGSYRSMSGTSMAAPQVAGAAALMQAVCGRRFSAGEFKDIVLNSVPPREALLGKVATGGIVDLATAVSRAASVCSALPEGSPTVTPTATVTAAPSATPTPIPTPTRSPTATPTLTPTPTNTPRPTNTPTRIPTPTRSPTATPTPRPSPTLTPTPGFRLASFFATVSTGTVGVPGAEVRWFTTDGDKLLLTQRTNYQGRILTVVEGERYNLSIAPYLGTSVYGVVQVPSLYVAPAPRSEPFILGGSNTVSFRVGVAGR